MRDRCVAIILAAGRGKRMKSEIQKQFLLLKEKPILYYSLKCFQDSKFIDNIVLVTEEDTINYCRREIVEKYEFSKVMRIISGGKERYDSVYAGLMACQGADYVFIHDGARPFISEEILQRGLRSVQANGAVTVGMPSKDTVKLVDQDGRVKTTLPRNQVWNIQTPQIFQYELILACHEKIRQEGLKEITDDAMVVEKTSGVPVYLVEGSYDNIKITTPEDLVVAERIVENYL